MLNEWRCIANNPQSGVSTWIFDDGEDVHIQTRQDVSALLDENTAIRNITQSGWRGDSLHSVARIPLSMLHDPLSSLGDAVRAGDEPWLKRFLNDSNHSKLRTKEGSL